jgi:hypothetical protein
MANGTKGRIALALLIVTVGIGWLLTAQGIMPGINWVWTLCLGIVGIATFVLSGGLDKVSVVVGPFLLISSVLSILRQTGRLSESTEMPLLVICIGGLLLLAQLPSIVAPRWLVPLGRPE